MCSVNAYVPIPLRLSTMPRVEPIDAFQVTILHFGYTLETAVYEAEVSLRTSLLISRSIEALLLALLFKTHA